MLHVSGFMLTDWIETNLPLLYLSEAYSEDYFKFVSFLNFFFWLFFATAYGFYSIYLMASQKKKIRPMHPLMYPRKTHVCVFLCRVAQL